MQPHQKQRGAVLIIVLWFITLIAVLVAVMASEIRLSAKLVSHNRENLENWSHTLHAWRAAEMELMMANMPADPEDTERQTYLEEEKEWFYRFDGRELSTAYGSPEHITVRIYDHAGKINLRLLSSQQMQQLLEKQIGEDKDDEIEELIAAWQDWVDNNDLKQTDGAEKDYYEDLSPPYQPRNAVIETVEEMLLIRGFAEIFDDFPLDAAFTVLGSTRGVNPNLATRESLLLVPGMTIALLEAIMIHRRDTPFKTISDFDELEIFRQLGMEQRSKFLPWMSFNARSPYYSIAIVANREEEAGLLSGEDNEQTDENAPSQTDRSVNKEEEGTWQQDIELNNDRAYTVTVQTRGTNTPPKVLMVNPYGILPDTRHEQITMEMLLDELE